MKNISKVILLSVTLATGAGSLAITNTANARTMVRKCWINRHGYQRCKIIRRRARHNNRHYNNQWCRRNGCYRPRYYNGPVIVGPVFRAPVIRFGWGARIW